MWCNSNTFILWVEDSRCKSWQECVVCLSDQYFFIYIFFFIIINFKVKNQSNPFLKSFVRVHEVWWIFNFFSFLLSFLPSFSLSFPLVAVPFALFLAEWLRRWTRNPLGSPRAVSNPADYAVRLHTEEKRSCLFLARPSQTFASPHCNGQTRRWTFLQPWASGMPWLYSG